MTTTQSAADALHRLLYRALIEIREQGRESGNKVVFHLADLFHTTALELGRAVEGKTSHDAILRGLEERATEKGVGRWLQTALAELEGAQPTAP